MSQNTYKQKHTIVGKSGGEAGCHNFPEHIRSHGNDVPESNPTVSRSFCFSGAYTFTFKIRVLSFKVFRGIYVHFSASSSYLCIPLIGKQRDTDMAGKITSMSKIKQVLLMHKNGMSNRKIAGAIGIDKCTVNEYMRKVKSSLLSIDALLSLEEPELEAQLFTGNPAYTDPRMNEFLEKLPYFREQLEDKHVTRVQLWSEYKQSNPSGYEKSQFFYHLRQNLVAQKQVGVLRDTYKPGEILMVDYAGDKLSYIDTNTGLKVFVEVFVATMPYSGLTYALAVQSQKVEDFVHAIRMCLESLGGVPQVIIPDNLKSAVIKADRWTPRLNQALVDMGNHYHFTVLPARAATPKDKAAVESDVNRIYHRVYAKLRNRTFYSLEELNKAVSAQVKSHNQTRMQEHPYTREERFHAKERGELGPLPEHAYEMKYTSVVTVNPQGEVRLAEDKHYYTVPYAYIGRKAHLIYTRSTLKIYIDNKCVASYSRQREPGGHTQMREHLSPQLQSYLDRSQEYYCRKAADDKSPELESFIRCLFTKRKKGVTDTICYNVCDFLFHLKRNTTADVFRKTVKFCEENEIFSKDDILSMSKVLDHQSEEYESSGNEVITQNHENTRGAASYQ